MNKKRNFASFAEAGVNIIAKLKKRNEDIIIPQNITYTEKTEEKDENVRNVVRNINKNTEKNEFSDITEETAEATEKTAEEAFSQFQSISTKLENIKKSLLEVISNSETKRNELFGNGLKKEDLQRELDKTAAEIEQKLNSIKEIMDKNGDFVAEALATYDSETKSNYTEISKNLQTVTESTEKTGQRIQTLEGTLKEANQKVGEIHQTTASIDKLYDSVFELKTANINNKEAIEELVMDNSWRFKFTVIVMSVLGVISIANLAILIMIAFSIA